MEHFPEVPSSPIRLMRERFTEVNKLGSGNFGDAFLVIDKKYNAYRVVKRLNKSIQQMNPKTLAESRAEIANLSRVDHHHVVRFYRAWVDADYHLHMLLEYCESGDLEDFVKQRFPLPEVLVRSLFMQLLVGLDEIHHNHLLHRDIKARNIFMTRAYVGHPQSPDPAARQAAAEVGRHVDRRVVPHLATDSKGFAIIIKIGDFGLSKALNYTEDKAKTVAGTPFHFSPELAKSQPYTRRTDVWSLGVLFYYIMTLSMPFRGKTIQEVFCSILREKVPHPWTRYKELYGEDLPYSAELIEVVMAMLNKVEGQRPTTEELLGRAYFGNAPSAAAAKEQTRRQRERHDEERGGEGSSGSSSGSGGDHDHSSSSLTSSPATGSAGTTNNSSPSGSAGTSRMCVARADALVNIRAQPSLRAPIIGTLRHLDEIEVVRAVDHLGHMWWEIISPVPGFCVSSHEGKELFVLKRSGMAPMRLSPLRTAETKGTAVKDDVSHDEEEEFTDEEDDDESNTTSSSSDDEDENPMMYSFSDACPPPPPPKTASGSGGRAAQDLRRLRRQEETARALADLQNTPEKAFFARHRKTVGTTALGNLTPPSNRTSHPDPKTEPRYFHQTDTVPSKNNPNTINEEHNARKGSAPPVPPKRAAPTATSTAHGRPSTASPRPSQHAAAPTPPAHAPPRKASPIASKGGVGGFFGAGHASPIRHRKSPQVVLPSMSPGGANHLLPPNGGRTSPLKFFREMTQQLKQQPTTTPRVTKKG